ncbi:MAG: acyltransferase [Halioglobus sp.]|nr:acyltransferase [Halioglobus sp.]
MKSITIPPANAAKYRSDIDGLRAIAVLSVILYHYGVKTFSGGFVGVDVFFVISGFLITRLILDAADASTFRFGNFYLRRVRRLLPAMLFTILASFLLGALLFSPTQLERLGGSTLHGLLSISNFFFWSESGYFDADSAVKPLLHLWSLSVEEQFYLIWPLSLILLTKLPFSRIVTPMVFVLLGIASWVFAEWCLRVDPSAAFFLLPSRIVEFCLGALMVWVTGKQLPGWLEGWLREVALLIGLLLIGYATITFTKETPFPGTNALIPCVGTSLALFGGSSRILGAVLRTRPMVFTGLISYSLYLCHWPIFVFFTYASGSVELSSIEIAGLTVFAFVVATLMYRFIERPFRFAKPGPDATLSSTRFALTCALLSLVLAYTSAHSWANGGWYWRYSNAAEVEELFDLDRLRAETIDFQREFVKGRAFRVNRKRILVVGDSHARDVSNGLYMTLAEKGYEVRMQVLDDICLQYISFGGEPDNETQEIAARECDKQIKAYRESMKSRLADIIIYSAMLSPETVESLDNFVKLAQTTSKNKAMQLIVMDRAVQFGAFHNQVINRFANGTLPEEINAEAAAIDTDEFLLDAIKAEFTDDPALHNVLVVSKRRYQCSDTSCDFFADDGTLAIWDDTHWTLTGAKAFMTRFADDYPELFSK